MPTLTTLLFYIYSPLKYLTLVCFSLLILACSTETPTPEAQHKNTSPSSSTELPPELETTFDQTCALCHSKHATGAPLVGDIQVWNKILSKGMDKTLDRVMNGYGGMPPAGQCFECSPDQLILLIEFMSGQAKQGDM